MWQEDEGVPTYKSLCEGGDADCRCHKCSNFLLLLLGRIAMTSIRCGLLLPLWRGLCVFVCLLVNTVSCTKTVEPIEMGRSAMCSWEPKGPYIRREPG